MARLLENPVHRYVLGDYQLAHDFLPPIRDFSLSQRRRTDGKSTYFAHFLDNPDLRLSYLQASLSSKLLGRTLFTSPGSAGAGPAWRALGELMRWEG